MLAAVVKSLGVAAGALLQETVVAWRMIWLERLQLLLLRFSLRQQVNICVCLAGWLVRETCLETAMPWFCWLVSCEQSLLAAGLAEETDPGRLLQSDLSCYRPVAVEKPEARPAVHQLDQWLSREEEWAMYTQGERTAGKSGSSMATITWLGQLPGRPAFFSWPSQLVTLLDFARDTTAAAVRKTVSHEASTRTHALGCHTRTVVLITVCYKT